MRSVPQWRIFLEVILVCLCVCVYVCVCGAISSRFSFTVYLFWGGGKGPER